MIYSHDYLDDIELLWSGEEECHWCGALAKDCCGECQDPAEEVYDNDR